MLLFVTVRQEEGIGKLFLNNELFKCMLKEYFSKFEDKGKQVIFKAKKWIIDTKIATIISMPS